MGFRRNVFDITFAFFSKIAVLGFLSTIDAIVAFIVLSVTYFMFRKLYTPKLIFGEA